MQEYLIPFGELLKIHTNPYIFVGHVRTELGGPVLQR